MIQISGLSKSFGLQLLLSNVTLQIGKGERVGITGRNGTGKSTLFKILVGEDQADSGAVLVPRNYKLGYLQQHLHFTHSSVLAEAVSSLKVHEDGFTEDHRAEAILFGLGFGKDDLERNPAELSGGFQIRLNLAKVLLSEPDMLLLDEPTNYLDILSVRWIERFLRNWPGELLLITHDRQFMNRVCTHVVGLHRTQLRKVQGSVEKLWETIITDEEVQQRTFENEAKKREQLEQFITRFRAQASKASAVQSKVKALARQTQTQELGANPKNLDFSFTPAAFPGKRVLQIKELSFRFSEQLPWLVKDLSLEIFKEDRIAIIGPNGRGKTTLLNLIANEFSPVSGQVELNPNVQIAYFGQTNIARLDVKKTVEEEIQSAVKEASRGRARSLAGVMMFEGDAALKQVKVLSGGERSRVLLAKILATPCNLLLLDEPTNHLDMESVESLVEAVEDYPGALIMVTHDEHMLHALATRLIVFDGNKAFLFEGTYADFLEKVGWEGEKSETPTKHVAGEKSSEEAAAPEKSKESRKQRAEYVMERSKILKPAEARVNKAEKDMAKVEEKIGYLEQELVNASEQALADKIVSLAKELDHAKNLQDQLIEEWTTAQSELEYLQAQYPSP